MEPTEKKTLANTGFSSQGKIKSFRFIKPDGTLNTNFKNVPNWQQYSFYHYLLSLKTPKFFLFVFLTYTVLNIIFATLYYIIGVDHLAGIVAETEVDKLIEAYFFSSQTLTTLGYGRISPVGMIANIVASLEALAGIITFAIIAGLIYGRFTKPKAYIKFSDVALISPFKDHTGLMFRIAPTKNHMISDVVASVTLSMLEEVDGNERTVFYELPLQVSRVLSLALSWTIVHYIKEDSPLYGIKLEEMDDRNVHVVVSIKAFDAGFSSTVMARTEYLSNQIVGNAAFKPMFFYNHTANRNDLDLRKVNDHDLL